MNLILAMSDPISGWRRCYLSLSFAFLVSQYACVSQPTKMVAADISANQLGKLKQAVPSSIKNRDLWATAIGKGILQTGKSLSAERICAVVAIIEQESGFRENPRVDNLPKIVKKSLLEKLEPLGPLARPAVDLVFNLPFPNQNMTFGDRVAGLQTERDLDLLFADLSKLYQDKMPGPYLLTDALTRLLGKGGLLNLNPIRTAGSMQVRVSFAKDYLEIEGKDDREIRDYLYSIEGGVVIGTARLIAYPANYRNILYRFADYNSGMYSSRNAALQEQLGFLTDTKLVLDGDFLAYDKGGSISSMETNSARAAKAFGEQVDMWDWRIESALEKEKNISFEQTALWKNIKKAYTEKTSRKAPYAIMPRVVIESPKLNSKKSTAWFANNVMRRYQRCRGRL